MAVQQGYGKMAGTDALVFAYDTGDAVNSYKGEPTENLIPDPLYNQGVINDYQDVNNTGWGTVTRGRVEDVSGPFGKTVKAYSQELISYTSSNRSMEGQASDVIDNINARFYLTAGLTYNLSIWIKANYTGLSSNRLYISGTAAVGDGTTREVNTEWQRISRNFTPTESGNYYMRHYAYASGKPVGSKIWYALPQVELKNYATPFVNGTRSATEGLLDLTGNETIDLSRTSFDSNADLDFDGTNDEIQIISSNWAQPGEDITVEAMVYREGYSENSDQYSSIINASNDATGIYSFSFYVSPTSNRLAGWLHSGTDSNSFDSGYVIQLNTWYHVAFTLKNGNPHTVKTFVNGVEQSSSTMGEGVRFANITKTTIGAYVDRNQYEWNGKIPIVKIYNRVLTPAEVKSNFNNYKTRFNIA